MHGTSCSITRYRYWDFWTSSSWNLITFRRDFLTNTAHTLHREQTNYIILQPDEEDSSCLRLLARMLRVSLLSVLSCLMNKNKQENNDNTIECGTWHTFLNTSLISMSKYLIHLLLQIGKMGNLHILHTYAKNTYISQSRSSSDSLSCA